MVKEEAKKKTSKKADPEAKKKVPKPQEAAGMAAEGLAKPKPKKAAKAEEASEIPTSPQVVTPEDQELAEVEEQLAREAKKPERYFEAVGRRKTSTARIRLFTRAGDFTVNGKPYGQYFPTLELQKIAEDALQKMKLLGRFKISAKISGGGTHGQAEALRHGLARSLIKFNPDFRKRLKRAGFLARDPRAKERKKFGLKKARRAPQWAKR